MLGKVATAAVAAAVAVAAAAALLLQQQLHAIRASSGLAHYHPYRCSRQAAGAQKQRQGGACTLHTM